ncbi:Ficolin-3 Collagen/fibrinogen domain-containing lectin 3 p35 [Takifugu flavidus]|uniref:Ficolin-3 Collagen/fibrinogen domain-containing lectin 3 p35 n=1 Tax=Takifugu flavidus TaxID=433684 RepID=A0A5C6PR81_9TELE|nr:Ficolin-3 Collagen/fibrinogen domain-containing lectin 3 p35 [Takifugu flavidus]
MKVKDRSSLFLVAPRLASGQLVPRPEITDSPGGIYPIILSQSSSDSMVFSDMKTDNGGWTVISSILDGTVNFYRPWKYYKVGFCKSDSEHWIGLDNIHHMMSSRKHELRVVLEDFEGNTVFAHYGSLAVGDES